MAMLEEETFESFGYYPSWLKPQSNKQILAQCDACGKVRILQKCAYHPLCLRCSRKGERNPNYGKNMSEAQKKKISDARKGQRPSDETRKKMSEARKGSKNHNYGKHLTEEQKKKISEAQKGKHHSPETEFKKGQLSPNKGKHLSEETRKKLSEKNTGKRCGWHHTEETLKKIREKRKLQVISSETKEKISEKHKKLWEDPEYVKRMMKACHVKPNKLEKLVDTILQTISPNEWKYNGDFSCGVTIAGLIPDFVNTNGQKAIIEVFSDWHNEQHMRKRFNTRLSWKRTEFGREAIYSQLGYKCIILWENDLKTHDAEQFVLKKLKEKGVAPMVSY